MWSSLEGALVLRAQAFEFLAGHFLFGNPWSMRVADYNLAAGRVWVLVLLATLVAPSWAWRRRSPARIS